MNALVNAAAGHSDSIALAKTFGKMTGFNHYQWYLATGSASRRLAYQKRQI